MKLVPFIPSRACVTLALCTTVLAVSNAHSFENQIYTDDMEQKSVDGRFPFPYNWSKFPCAWFGSNSTNWESETQLQEIGKYSMAILGWQHLANLTDWNSVVYTQLTQASIIKSKFPNLPVFVYTGFGFAFGMNGESWTVMNDLTKKDWFLQSKQGPVYTQTNCEQTHTSPGATEGRCVGYFWNMANVSARDYFISNIVQPLAEAPMIDGIFYDAFNYAYDIPEVRPWGRATINVPNCTNMGGVGCESLLNGTLDVAQRTAALLNKHNKVPIYANPGTFVKPAKQNIWLDETRLVKALEGMGWFTYYESARAEQMISGGFLPNMLQEAKLGVAAGVHTYYHNATEDPTPHMAAFMLARSEHWYYFGSTGWWDDSFVWTDLYDKASQCGMPTEPCSSGPVYRRDYQHCQVVLDCTNSSFCVGDITFNHS
eukprot:m.40818 g.40818  ORF g.40818 m.40818 type:complete len:428 (+) comp18624_c0_seq1:210-1493(+)